MFNFTVEGKYGQLWSVTGPFVHRFPLHRCCAIFSTSFHPSNDFSLPPCFLHIPSPDLPFLSQQRASGNDVEWSNGLRDSLLGDLEVEGKQA
jgi:hypothetical protein